jgi:hypothetical protein
MVADTEVSLKAVSRLSSRRLARRAGRSGDCRVRVDSRALRSGGCGEVVVQDLGGRSPAERLPRPAVQHAGDGGEVVGAVAGEVGAFRELLAQKPVGVLVAAALPWALGVAEADLETGIDAQLGVVGHLGALVSGQ